MPKQKEHTTGVRHDWAFVQSITNRSAFGRRDYLLPYSRKWAYAPFMRRPRLAAKSRRSGGLGCSAKSKPRSRQQKAADQHKWQTIDLSRCCLTDTGGYFPVGWIAKELEPTGQ